MSAFPLFRRETLPGLGITVQHGYKAYYLLVPGYDELAVATVQYLVPIKHSSDVEPCFTRNIINVAYQASLGNPRNKMRTDRLHPTFHYPSSQIRHKYICRLKVP